MDQPNILLIMADQLSAFALPCYGHPVVKAPHIDRARRTRACVFENAYCNSPLCAPSRASMLTGRLPSRIGAYDNASRVPAPASRPSPTTCARRLPHRASPARCTSSAPTSCTASRSG